MLLKPVRAPRLLPCSLLTLFFAAASHAAPADPFPPPGLYRVDADTTVQQREGTLQTVGNGADDSGFIEGRAKGEPPVRHNLAPGAPITTCMPPRAPNTIALPRSDCKPLGAMVTTAQGTRFGMQCGSLQLTMVVTKLDAKTWQYRSTSVEQLGGATGALPDFAMQRKMFEQSAKNGPTPEDRADAAAVLQHWDAYVADARGAASEAAQAPRRVEQRSATSVTRLTRIADNCSTTSRQ